MFCGQNEKMIKRARNVEKRIERLKTDQVDKPILERKTMGLSFQLSSRGSDKVLEMKDVAKSFDGAAFVLETINLLIWQGERVGLVGPNGAGKSVLFRLILGHAKSEAQFLGKNGFRTEEPTWGSIKLGPSVQTTYYAQEHQTLDYDSTPVEEVRAIKPMYEREAFGYLGRFLFGFQKAQQAVKTLSGGEKARLQMAKLMLSPANFLLLDEPTNNLDIPSCEVLEDALQDFRGTLLMISHDRYFLDRLCTRIVELRDGKLVEYAGNYTFYQQKKREEGQAGARRISLEKAI